MTDLLLLHRQRCRCCWPQTVEGTIAEFVGMQTSEHADQRLAHDRRRFCLTQVGP